MLAVTIDMPARLVGVVADLRDEHDALAEIEADSIESASRERVDAADHRAVDHDLDAVLAARG